MIMFLKLKAETHFSICEPLLRYHSTFFYYKIKQGISNNIVLNISLLRILKIRVMKSKNSEYKCNGC
jgi:hypothetical protein